MFISPPKPNEPNRHRRVANVGLAACAAVELLGERLAVDGADECNSNGIFGHRQDESKADAENIRNLAEFQDSQTFDCVCC